MTRRAGVRAVSLAAAAVCAALSAPACAAATESSRSTLLENAALVDRCEARLVPEIDVGYGRIAQRCPELRTLGLPQSGIARLLPADWTRTNDLTAAGLKQLSRILHAMANDSVQRPAPSLSKLGPALARFSPKPAPSGPWARFRAWLRHVLSSPEMPSEPRALPGWLHVPAPIVARLIVGAAVLCILLAAFGILRFTRHSGVLSRMDRARRRRKSPVKQTDAPDGAAPREIEHAPLLEQPALLLRSIVPLLGPGAAAWTNGELRRSLAACVGAEAEDLRGLDPLLAVAEGIRFDRKTPAEREVRAALRDGYAVARALGGSGRAAAEPME